MVRRGVVFGDCPESVALRPSHAFELNATLGDTPPCTATRRPAVVQGGLTISTARSSVKYLSQVIFADFT